MSTILNFILASGLLGTLLFYKSKRRTEQAQAQGAEIHNRQSEFELQRQAVEFLGSQLTEAYTEIDKMQEIISKKREEIIELIRQTKKLEIQLIQSQNTQRKAELNACYTGDCTLRKEAVQL